ncbi:MAG: glycerophosphodiester phosphodiesterase [Bacteroidales bacterium]
MRTFILSTLLTLSCLFAQAHTPMVVAHRGASAYRPENTLSAFKYAFELDADAIEVDIWVTKDRKIVVTHDRDTKRVADKNLIVPESTYSELKELKLKDGEYMPLLEEVFAILPKGKKIFIEIKCCWEKGESGNPFPELKKIIKRSKREKDCTFIAFNSESLVNAKKELPKIPTYLLSGKKDSNQELVDMVKSGKLTALNLHHSLVNEQLSELLIENNIPLYVWTVNKDEDMGRMLETPLVKGITTDRPDALIKLIKEGRIK